MNNNRPVNLDLTTIRFPATAIASILHRVSGVITFFIAGILMWLLAMSLSSEQGFDTVLAIMTHPLAKLVLWGMLTAFAYHFVGGIRHLIQDFGYCEELPSGAISAKLAFAITAVLSILAGVWVW